MPAPSATPVNASPMDDHPSGVTIEESTEDDPSRVNLSEIEFNRLLAECYNKIHAHIKRRVGDPCLAEDITQEVFLRAWTTPPRDRTSSVMPWLYTVARNLIADHFRSQREHLAISDVSEDIADGSSLLAQEQAEAQRTLEEILAEADPSDQERATFTLWAEGVTIEAISHQLDLSFATVKSSLQRFRARCRKTEAARWAHADGPCG